MYHSKKICVFISHIYGEYQLNLCAGVARKAAEYGYTVDFFASNDGENLGDYGAGEHSILQIPRPENYAGVIIASGTYLLPSLEQDIKRLLKTQFTCPIIDVSQRASEYPRVVFDNYKAVSDIVVHLGNIHHYKDIFYLGCNVETDYDIHRQNAFKNGMAELSLPTENHMFFCDFSKESIITALDSIFAITDKPDAIVCYNDRIALDVISILKDRDLSVPDDIAVTGCDTLEFGQKMSPVLTSVDFPTDLLGEKAIEQLARIFQGEEIEDMVTVYASPSYGTSCGCPDLHPVNDYIYSQELNDKVASLERNVISDMYMSANLQGVVDIDQGMNLIADFVQSLNNCRELYLCLYEGWDSISSHIREITLTDEEEYDSDTVLLKLAFKDGQRLPECTFTKHNMLPDYLYDGQSTAYIYAPLFFGEKSFGYMALSYKDGKAHYPFHFISWLMNVNSMLNAICDKKNLGLLVGRLEDIYTKDELTGLLNRQGFKITYQPVLEKAIAEKQPVLAVMYDLDGLKLINDTFGHAEGDFAIQVVAHALESSIEEGDICSRQGGDEFQIFGIGYTYESAKQLVEKVQKYLDNYNKLHTKDYLIKASCGFSIKIPTKVSDISDMFEAADQSMYVDKRSKDKQILKNNNQV